MGEREATWLTQDLVKPRETKDKSMQQADTQIPLRCSSPANSDFFFAGAVRARSSDGHQYILFWLAIPP